MKNENMKKLLITTLAAVSVGLCAKADFAENGTSFEGLTEGDVFNPADTYWTIPTDTDDVFKITNVTYSADATPQHWDLTTGEMALSIDTANPILRNVNPVPNGDTTIINPPQDVTTPVFFDSVVQFTATDVAPSMENNTTDKLAVWLYTSPDDVSDTNLGLFGETSPITRVAITAGYLEDGATVKVRNYLTNIEVDPNTWHRLTIKSFVKSGRPWYSVWVDKTPVNGKAAIDAEEELTEFLSMVSDEVNTETYTKLQGVAFDGKGAVDDIVFTTTAPEFAKEPEAEKYAFTLKFTENVEIIAFEIGKEVYTSSVSSGASYDVAVGDRIYLSVAPEEGYSLTFNGGTFAPDEFGGYEYSFTPSDAGSGTVTITATQGSGAKPTIGSTSYETEAALKAVVKDGTQVTVPSGWTVEGKVLKDNTGEIFATFEYYNLALADGIVTATLDQKAAAPFAEATDLTEGQEVLEVGEDASGNPELTVRIKPYVGLYYGAMTGTTLDNMTLTSEYQKATSTDVIAFTAKGKAGDTASFIKVVVTDIAPESTEE